MLKLKLQHFGHLMQRADSLEKNLKTEGRRRRDENEMAGWHHRLSGHEFEQTPEDGEGQGDLAAAVHGVAELDTTELKSGGASDRIHLPLQEAKETRLIPGSGRFPGVGNAPHSSILTWKIPWAEEPDGLQSMGSKRVRHD